MSEEVRELVNIISELQDYNRVLTTQRSELLEKVRGLKVTTMWGYGYALQRDEVLAIIEGEK
jgi:hypothetical protein